MKFSKHPLLSQLRHALQWALSENIYSTKEELQNYVNMYEQLYTTVYILEKQKHVFSLNFTLFSYFITYMLYMYHCIQFKWSLINSLYNKN